MRVHMGACGAIRTYNSVLALILGAVLGGAGLSLQCLAPNLLGIYPALARQWFLLIKEYLRIP
jgi:hypothetical protein